MSAIWNLFVRVKTDEKALQDATNSIKKKFKEAWDVAEKNMPDQVAKWAKKMESSFSSLWRVIAGIFSITAVTMFVKKLFQAWSDLEETTSKFNQVFLGQADANKRFEDLAASLGRSELQMKQFGSTTGSILKPLGFATEDALDLSEAITRLSIDIASFNNVSDEQANNALNRALTGEREALKSLGIALNETDIKNEYLRLGFSKTGDELSKQGKALATLSLLYKQTADAQGDAVRTGESWANQLKRFKGTVLDAFADAGRQLSNDSASTLQQVNRYIVAYWAAFLKSIVTSTGLILSQLAVVGGSISEFFGILTNNTNKAASEQLSFAGLVAKTILAIGTGIKAIVRLIQFFGEVIGNTLGVIVVGTGDTVDAFSRIWAVWAKAVVALFKSLWPAIAGGVWNAVFLATEKIVGFINNIKNKVPWVASLLGDLSNPFTKWSADFDTSWFASVSSEIVKLKNTVAFNFKALKEPFTEFSNDIVDIGTDFEQASSKINEDFKKGVLDSGRVQGTIAEQVARQKEEEKKTLEELVRKYKDAQSAGEQSGKWQKAASEDAKKAVEKLKEETKKLEDSIKDLEKAQKDEDEATKKYHQDRINELRKIGEEMDKNIRKHEETIKLIDKERDKKIGDSRTSEQNQLAERYAEIEKEISDLRKDTDEDNRAENENKINELKREQAIIQWSIAQSTIDEAVRVSNLTEAERIQLEALKERKSIEDEATNKKAEADAELLVEQEKLKKKQQISEYFMNLERFTRKNLKDLENSEKFKELDVETQNEILRQWEERLALEEKKNFRIDLENQVNDEVIRLSNVSTEVQKTNLASLDAEYKKVIASLDAAIARQRTLNALRSSGGWFAEGGYTGDGGKYDVAGVVHKWEYVVPQHVLKRSPDLLGSLEAMRQGQNITNNKAVNFWGNVIVQNAMDFELFLDKQKFRL